MEKERLSDGLMPNFLRSARDFTPITVSADFAAMYRPGEEASTKKTGAGMASNPLNHNYEGVTTRTGL